jgi:DNA-binding transcriptional ArsR family regulator
MTELAEPFLITRIAVAKHIRVLEGAGLISRCAEGRIVQCSMNVEPLREIEEWLTSYRHFWTQQLESLARFVEAGSPAEHRPRRKV